MLQHQNIHFSILARIGTTGQVVHVHHKRTSQVYADCKHVHLYTYQSVIVYKIVSAAVEQCGVLTSKAFVVLNMRGLMRAVLHDKPHAPLNHFFIVNNHLTILV